MILSCILYVSKWHRNITLVMSFDEIESKKYNVKSKKLLKQKVGYNKKDMKSFIKLEPKPNKIN